MSNVAVNEELKRVPLVQGGMSFEDVTDVVCKPVETKAPSWWFIALAISLSLVLLLKSMLAYLFWEGVGIWGLNNPVGWGYATVNFVFFIIHP